MTLNINSNHRLKSCMSILKKVNINHKRSCKNLIISSKKELNTKPEINNVNFMNNKQITKNVNQSWRVLFFGTDSFALESLRKLEQEYRLKSLVHRLEVVTSYKGNKNEVMTFAEKSHLKIHQWSRDISLNDFDIGIVVSFGHLIPTSVINLFPLGMINVHASLLPRWRGAAPIIYSLLNGDTKTGLTIIKIKPKKFDIGEILAQETVNIGPNEMQPELHKKLAVIGADLLLRTVQKLPDILNEGIPQPTDGITYAPKVTRDIATVKWSQMNAKNVYNLERALFGIYPLESRFQGQTLKLYNVKLLDGSQLPFISNELNIMPGLIVYDKRLNLLRVQCKDGNWVSIEVLTLKNYKRMTAKEFNNGFLNKKKNKIILET